MTACVNSECPLRTSCYRYRVEWGHRQSISLFTWTDVEPPTCRHFLGIVPSDTCIVSRKEADERVKAMLDASPRCRCSKGGTGLHACSDHKWKHLVDVPPEIKHVGLYTVKETEGTGLGKSVIIVRGGFMDGALIPEEADRAQAAVEALNEGCAVPPWAVVIGQDDFAHNPIPNLLNAAFHLAVAGARRDS